MPHSIRAFLFVLMSSSVILAEGGGSGKGGPFIEYHANSLANFDSSVSGNPLVIGGYGFGSTSKNFRLGGGGGGGFLWNGSDNAVFGIGYGGIVGEYIVTSWLSLRMLIGGGGYAVGKITAQTDTTVTTEKISSGGFLLFHPSVFMSVRLSSWCQLGANLGYFLPNVGKLHSFTAGLNLLMGK